MNRDRWVGMRCKLDYLDRLTHSTVWIYTDDDYRWCIYRNFHSQHAQALADEIFKDLCMLLGEKFFLPLFSFAIILNVYMCMCVMWVNLALK